MRSPQAAEPKSKLAKRYLAYHIVSHKVKLCMLRVGTPVKKVDQGYEKVVSLEAARRRTCEKGPAAARVSQVVVRGGIYSAESECPRQAQSKKGTLAQSVFVCL